ncbi:sigma-70 family RNA polymerase sigma factor, partial [Patescibacteria group bacterium]|nr:sigma-70 family RNA polymerase sigma factor [Patescibacteria group bacterium]
MLHYIFMKNSDIKIINRYLKGDEKSFEMLVQNYIKSVYSFAYKYTKNTSESEGITQEVFIKVWKNIKKFDQKKSFKTWIFAITKNTALDYIKKK